MCQNINEFRTKAVKLSFLCIDSTGYHPKGDVVKYECEILLDDNIRFCDQEGRAHIKIRTAPQATVKYTTDGSNPRYNGKVAENGDITIPDNTRVINVVAEKDGVFSEIKNIPVRRDVTGNIVIKQIELDYTKPVKLKLSGSKKILIFSIEELQREIELLKNYKGKFVAYSLDIYRDDDNYIVLTCKKPQGVELSEIFTHIEKVKTDFYNDGIQNVRAVITELLFEDAKDFEEWIKQKGKTLHDFKEAITQNE